MTQKSEQRRQQWIRREIVTNEAVWALWKEISLRTIVGGRKAREHGVRSVRQNPVCSAFNLETEYRGGRVVPPRSYC